MRSDEGSPHRWSRPRKGAGADPPDPVFVGLVRRFGRAIDRFLGRDPNVLLAPSKNVPTDDDPDDGGLASAGVRRRPPGHSGSGSVAIDEPHDPDATS